MQPNREGIDITRSQHGHIDLERHLKEHGLSEQGYQKIYPDIENGDMSADILAEFDENELLSMADGYNMTILQKKAFIKGVKMLPNSKASIESVQPHDGGESVKHIFLTSEEQAVLTQIHQLKDNLHDHSTSFNDVKNENKSTIEQTIEKLKVYGNTLKNTIDNTVNALIEQVKFHNQ